MSTEHEAGDVNVNIPHKDTQKFTLFILLAAVVALALADHIFSAFILFHFCRIANEAVRMNENRLPIACL